MNNICPICQSKNIQDFHKDNRRQYLKCQNCYLVFVPKEFHLSQDEEKMRYDFHQNSENDRGYRKFLNRIFEPMNSRIAPESFGLDFGSGPGPTLSLMFQEAGHKVNIYDINYSKDESVFKIEYDFITASEVVEHIKQPLLELKKLWRCLKTGGYLGIMTKMVLDQEAFSKWHYINDMTHISFFSLETFEWIGKHFESKPEFVDKDVVIFEKK